MNTGTTRRNFLRCMGLLASGFIIADASLIFPPSWGANTNEIKPIYTHFPDLDRIIDGFGPFELVLLAGRPFTGKTSLAVDIAVSATVDEGMPVGIFSLDWSNEGFAWDILSRVSGVSIESMRKGTLSTTQISLLLDHSKILNNAPIWINDNPDISFSEFSKIAYDLTKQHSVKLIIVDYLQLMRDWSINGGVVKKLKAVAVDLGVPILLVSTLPRRIDYRPDKRPRLSDLAPQWKGNPQEIVEPYADIVLFTYRDRFSLQQLRRSYLREFVAAEDTEIAEIIVAKNRHGATGTVKLRFDEKSDKFIS
ncbi:MAG: DnaB-like helicase C-terminal domain-containing protein [Syntrophobacteraceae bacterium]